MGGNNYIVVLFQDVTFYLWQFRAPATTESLTIRNCTTLRFSFLCSNENKPIRRLHIANITNLEIIKTSFTQNPQSVIFEHIGQIDYIPEDSFFQITKRIPLGSCNVRPVADLQNVRFIDVNIGFISPKAFNDLKDFYHFSWHNVKVMRMQHLAIELEFNKTGNFSVSESSIDVLEHLSFKIIGHQAFFLENKFVDVNAGAINGTLGNFTFRNNSVNNFQSYGISILAENVVFADNRFEYLRAGAFEKISPGLLHDSRRNFASIRFLYQFTRNTVNFMDAASLNPDVEAYGNVASDITFLDNGFFCSCENLGWMLSSVGHGQNTAALKSFYETLIADQGNENFCSYTTCHLSLENIYLFLNENRCFRNLSAENLCRAKSQKQKSTTIYAENSPEMITETILNAASSNQHILSKAISSIYCFSLFFYSTGFL